MLSVTGKGQSVISTAMTTFENFLTGSIKLKNIDELLIYTNKIKKECDSITSLPEILLDDVSDEKVKERLKTYCENGIMNLDSVIDKIIESCNQKQKNLLYFKNNLFAFLEEKPVFSLIETIMKKVKEFRNAAEPPKEIEEDLNKLWHMAKYYVFYNHVKFNKINILKNDEREAVLGVDTDSNFLGLFNQYNIIKNNLGLDRNNDEDTFKVVSILAYLLQNVITESYALYTKNCNVPENKRYLIAMKNEYIIAHLKII